ncbi:MAG: AAA family ATPase, partial [Erysipelotrichaceae bacterium]
MRPIKLELENFITFAGKHEIDFEKLQSDSLFLLMGETGAGKTSIFDAIFFALFGESTNKEREATTLRSNYANPSEETKVVFTFALGNQTYTIERNPLYTRNAKRGDKTVDEKPNATLQFPQGNPIEGVSKVNAEVKSLLGLEPDQFKQLVMIPQNEFRKLISSNSNEREAIFMRLFDTQIYTSIVERIKVENRQISNQVSGKKELRKAMMQRFFSIEEPRLQAQLQDMDVEDARVLGIARDTSDHLSQEIDTLKKQYDGNQTRLRSLEIQKVYCDTLVDLQVKQQTIQESVNTLSQQASAIQQAKQVLEHSTKVFGLVQPYQRLQLETQTLANKQKLLGDLLREQTTLADKQAQLEAQKTAKAEEWNTIAQKQTTLEHVQASIARWDSYQATLVQQQALESAWVSAVLKQVQTLKTTTKAYLNAKSSTSKQQSRYDDMVVAYQSNIAGELASELVVGKPCQVCGS